MLKLEPKERLSLEQIFQHPFVKKHFLDYLNNHEKYKFIPPQASPDVVAPDLPISHSYIQAIRDEHDAQNNAIVNQNSHFLDDPLMQQELVRKAMIEENLTEKDVKKAVLIQDAQGILRVRFVLSEEMQILKQQNNSANLQAKDEQVINLEEKQIESDKQIVNTPESKIKRQKYGGDIESEEETI